MHTNDLIMPGRRVVLVGLMGLALALIPTVSRAAAKSEKAGSAKAVAGVGWNGPTGQPVSVMKVRLSLPETAKLPADSEQVKRRISGAPENAVVVVNRGRDSVDVVVSRAESLPRGQLFVLDFDSAGSAAPGVECKVLDCASSFGPVAGCTCALSWY